MASLRAKSRFNTGSSEVVNKILSLSGFLILMAAGWLALCYVRSSLERRSGNGLSREAATAQVPLQPQLQPPVRLVYSAAADRVYYHSRNHVPSKGEQSALSEEAARQLGLKPCPICERKYGRTQSPAESDRRGASESPK